MSDLWLLSGLGFSALRMTSDLWLLSGLNFNALRMQLETLLLNPGIQPSLVTVHNCSVLT